MTACVFCSVLAGTAPAYPVYADTDNFAFLDHRPLLPGHVLVVPRRHVETLGDLPADKVGLLFEVVQRVSVAVERGMRADGSLVAINIKISQSVPHLHVHVVPRRKNDRLFAKTFQWIRRPYPNEDAIREAQRAIVSALAAQAR